MQSPSGSLEKKCCLKSVACVEGALYCVSCRCGQQYYLCPNHSEKVVKEAQQSHSKLLNRKGEVSRSPLEKICNIGHKNFNQILMLMANTTSAFRATECTGRLLVSDKIVIYSKLKAKPQAAGKALLPVHSDPVVTSPHSLPASAGESHPNYKTAMCRYGDRCIYGDRCSFAHNESELRAPTYAVNSVLGGQDVDVDVVPSVSVGPGGGKSVTVANPITKSASNETFVMQKDDFPGLPGSSKQPTAWTAVAGAGSDVLRQSYSAAAPGPSQLPSQAQPLQPNSSGPAQPLSYNSMPGLGVHRAPTSPPINNIQQPNTFEFSEFGKAVPEASPVARMGSGLADAALFDNRFSVNKESSNPSAATNGFSGHGFFGSQPSGGLGGDLSSVDGLNNRSMFNSNSNNMVGGYFDSFSGVHLASSGMSISGGGLPHPLHPGSYRESAPASRLDMFAGQTQFSARPIGGDKDLHSSMGSFQSQLPMPPSIQQQQLHQQQLHKQQLEQQQLKEQQLQQQQLEKQQLEQQQLWRQQQQQMQMQQQMQRQQQMQQQQMQQVAKHTTPAVAVAPQVSAPPGGGGIDADLVPPNTFASVDWLRASDMGIFRWSGNDRAWTEFAMHVPANFYSFFASNLPTWKQHSNCNMWFDKDKLRGEMQNFLVFRRGENGEEANQAMEKALELISHHLSFILVKNEANTAISAPRQRGAPTW